MALVLASASPRRRELLGLITTDFIIDVSDCDESLPEGTAPREAVELLAARKANAVFSRRGGDVIIGADTVVELGGEILGKPQDRGDAVRMLRMLSGRAHWVHTGVCVRTKDCERRFVVSAEVRFGAMSEREISDYAASGECDDKAGSYAVQGLGARFVEEVRGDYHAVIGLPVRRLYQTLCELGAIG